MIPAFVTIGRSNRDLRARQALHDPTEMSSLAYLKHFRASDLTVALVQVMAEYGGSAVKRRNAKGLMSLSVFVFTLFPANVEHSCGPIPENEDDLWFDYLDQSSYRADRIVTPDRVRPSSSLPSGGVFGRRLRKHSGKCHGGGLEPRG